jgi:hypothetical protein
MVRIHLLICPDEEKPICLWFVLHFMYKLVPAFSFSPGIDRDELGDDPQLGGRRQELVIFAAHKLAEARMIVFNEQAGTFTITDLGRIAAKYYIRHASIVVFNKVRVCNNLMNAYSRLYRSSKLV